MADLPSRLLIAGASARAAATLSGVEDLHTCDLFADHDLCQVAKADRIPGSSFPHGFLDWAAQKQVADSCWMYTGGLENHPDLVNAISAHHELLGCRGEVLAAVRDPLRMTDVINGARIDQVKSPAVSLRPDLSPTSGGYSNRVVRKPRSSCGGLGILELVGQSPDSDAEDQSYYYQEFVEGVPQAGLFLANGEECRLLGVTRSWVNRHDVASNCEQLFRYGGSLGPLDLHDPNSGVGGQLEGGTWLRLGELLSKQFEMRGLFGVDAIVTRDGTIAPLEINPRFTASMELLPPIEERTIVDWHIATCRTGALPDQESCLRKSGQGRARSTMAGKGILYAPQIAESAKPVEWNDQLRKRLANVAATHDATLADLPVDGVVIAGGSPMLTVLVHGDDPDKIRTRLSWSSGQLFELIWKCVSSPRL